MRRLVLPLLLAMTFVSAVSACGDDDTTLRVTRLSRNTLNINGSDWVIVYGNGFTAVKGRNVTAYFGTKQGTFKRFVSDDEMLIEAPGGKPGEKVDLTLIFEPGGTKKIEGAFTYVEKNQYIPTVEDLDTDKTKK